MLFCIKNGLAVICPLVIRGCARDLVGQQLPAIEIEEIEIVKTPPLGVHAIGCDSVIRAYFEPSHCKIIRVTRQLINVKQYFLFRIQRPFLAGVDRVLAAFNVTCVVEVLATFVRSGLVVFRKVLQR